MYDTILIPFDGTEEAMKAAEHGIGIAAAVGASIHALYVIDLPGAPRTVYVRDDEEEMREEYREYGEEVTGDLCADAAEAGVECTSVMRSGSPAEEIVSYAEAEDVDAIVMGAAYRGKIGAFLGGTTDRVVRTAPAPVITTRMQVDE
ncbi:universal stress protein [Halobacteriales archaeon QS_8_69_26]|nr:MAG: universal stress protein [Halobacteriales archaeon QS_8_69_26]